MERALFGIAVSIFLAANPTMAQKASSAFAMQVMDAFNISGRGTILTGQISSGIVEVGDTICVPLASGGVQPVTVSGIEIMRKQLKRADAGQMVGLLVSGVERDDVEKQAVLNADCTKGPDDTPADQEQNN
jgi:elongation factor Tu